MSKQIIECPYSIRSAQDIWSEGLKAGIEYAMEYTESKKKIPTETNEFEIYLKERNNDLNAMTGTECK